MAKPKNHILLVEARFYGDIADMLADGALDVLDKAGATHSRIVVPGALEIPAAVAMGKTDRRFDGFVALGCVIRGETPHFEIVAGESAQGLTWLGVEYGLAIGNGILTVEDRAQALVRADPEQKNKGGAAAEACLAMIRLRQRFVGSGGSGGS
jgi:6,7-dimethyl-8-ribityllumazine synthase